METLTFTFCGQLIFLAFFVACLEMTFQYFMQPNMILYPWAVLIAKISHWHPIARHLMRPMGRCRYCNGIWISFYVFVFFFGYSITVLLMFGLVTLFIKLLSDYVFVKEFNPLAVDEKFNFTYAQDNTWQEMMKGYAILGAFYLFMYVGVPLIIHGFNAPVIL
jgi:hypothetical protein